MTQKRWMMSQTTWWVDGPWQPFEFEPSIANAIKDCSDLRDSYVTIMKNGITSFISGQTHLCANGVWW